MSMIFSERSRDILKQWANDFQSLADVHCHTSELAGIMSRAANGEECSDYSLMSILDMMNEPSDLDEEMREQCAFIRREISLYMAVD